MMKKLITLSTIFAFSISVAQEKLLTIQDAVIKGRNSLAPKRLLSLSFINGSDQFSYVLKDALIFGKFLGRFVVLGNTHSLPTTYI